MHALDALGSILNFLSNGLRLASLETDLRRHFRSGGVGSVLRSGGSAQSFVFREVGIHTGCLRGLRCSSDVPTRDWKQISLGRVS